jgi:hypothetical protein
MRCEILRFREIISFLPLLLKFDQFVDATKIVKLLSHHRPDARLCRTPGRVVHGRAVHGILCGQVPAWEEMCFPFTRHFAAGAFILIVEPVFALGAIMRRFCHRWRGIGFVVKHGLSFPFVVVVFLGLAQYALNARRARAMAQ